MDTHTVGVEAVNKRLLNYQSTDSSWNLSKVSLAYASPFPVFLYPPQGNGAGGLGIFCANYQAVASLSKPLVWFSDVRT